jgi:hypothetical protein
MAKLSKAKREELALHSSDVADIEKLAGDENDWVRKGVA